jgi:hypothetical protein
MEVNKMNAKELGQEHVDYIHLVKDRDRRQALVNVVVVTRQEGNIFTS